jgi:PAS domain S-box-containing protein
MSLRTRVLLSIIVAISALIVITYLISSFGLSSGMHKLEEDSVKKDATRVSNVLVNNLSNLDATVADWAIWTDTYEFIQAPDQQYIDNNIVDSSFVTLDINFMLFFDINGEMVYGRGFDLKTLEQMAIPASLESHLKPGNLLLQNYTLESKVTGILQLPEAPLLVSSRPILTSQGEGPIEGTLIMGRYLDQELINYLSELADLSVTVNRYNANDLPANVKKAAVSLSAASPVTVLTTDKNSLTGYSLVTDIYGSPALILSMDTPRTGSQLAHSSSLYILIGLITCGIIFIGMSTWSANKWEFGRLSKLGNELKNIGTSKDLSMRVNAAGKDEISTLATTVNNTLEALENSQKRRLETEEALKESEEKFAKAFLSSPESISITSMEEGKFIDVNNSFIRMTGFSREEAIGHSALELGLWTNTEDRRRTYEILSAEGRVNNIEAVFRTRSGELKTWLLAAEKIELNKKPSVIWMITDITARKQMEQEREKAEKLESIGTLAGGIAHDFNNLLTGIMGNVSLAKTEIEPGGELYETLDEVEKASIRAKALTQQLLTFARGGMPLRELANVKELLVKATGFTLTGSNVKVDYNIPDDLWQAELDEAQLSQTINNLVINAKQAMHQGGLIKVGARNLVLARDTTLPLPPGNYIEITIEDQGIGIPKENYGRIFSPYFSTKKNGSGMGLATAYSITKKHNGHITFESTPGKGTIFFVYLPAIITELPEIKTGDNLIHKGNGRILVVDDEESILKLLQIVLHRAGYEVELTRDGEEGVEKYISAAKAGKTPDAVIMDLTMPGGVDGMEATRKIHAFDPAAKVIVSSGYSTDPIMAEYKKYGFDAAVSKPYDVNILTDTLHNILSKTN